VYPGAGVQSGAPNKERQAEVAFDLRGASVQIRLNSPQLAIQVKKSDGLSENVIPNQRLTNIVNQFQSRYSPDTELLNSITVLVLTSLVSWRIDTIHRHHHSILIRSPRRPRNTNTCPENGFSFRTVCACALSLVKSRRRYSRSPLRASWRHMSISVPGSPCSIAASSNSKRAGSIGCCSSYWRTGSSSFGGGEAIFPDGAWLSIGTQSTMRPGFVVVLLTILRRSWRFDAEAKTRLPEDLKVR